MILVAVLWSTIAATPWCDALHQAVAAPWPDDGPTQTALIEAWLKALPPEAQSIEGHVRGLMGMDGSVDAARDVLRSLARDGCAAPPAHAGHPADEVRALQASDARFAGVRVGDDVLDRVVDRFWRWVTTFLESRGMQRYAGSARVIYLAVLGAAILLVGARLLRAWRARAAEDDAARDDPRARTERVRTRAYRDLLAEARAALMRDPRLALALGREALLARIGQQAPDAASPARTARELLAALQTPVADAVREPLLGFDVAFFSRDPSVADAQHFLTLVEHSEQALQAGVGAPP